MLHNESWCNGKDFALQCEGGMFLNPYYYNLLILI
jgi:hypothetical protein